MLWISSAARSKNTHQNTWYCTGAATGTKKQTPHVTHYCQTRILMQHWPACSRGCMVRRTQRAWEFLGPGLMHISSRHVLCMRERGFEHETAGMDGSHGSSRIGSERERTQRVGVYLPIRYDKIGYTRGPIWNRAALSGQQQRQQRVWT